MVNIVSQALTGFFCTMDGYISRPWITGPSNHARFKHVCARPYRKGTKGPGTPFRKSGQEVSRNYFPKFEP